MSKIIRILWIAPNGGLMPTKNGKSYNGGGWIAGLQTALILYSNGTQYKLGIAFPTEEKRDFKIEKDGCTYYPVYSRKSLLTKITDRFRWKGSNENMESYKQAIKDFKPNIIHVFGVELPHSNIIGQTNIPTVVHLQGFLNPCLNAYFPPGMAVQSLIKKSSIFKEILGIGISYKYKAFRSLAKKELKVLSMSQFVMGRTEWDNHITDLLTNGAKYFHVDEVLRPNFYSAPKWKYRYDGNTIRIVTTISPSTYKGLDLILKTALLMNKLKIRYSWTVVGITSGDDYVRLFKKQYKIDYSKQNITFWGRKSADEIIELMMKSDLYIHPSYIDNSPNSVCEAQMLGIPVVACNVGGVSSLIKNGITGLLIPANAPYELVYIIKHYIDIPMEQLSHNEIEMAEKRHDRRNVVNALFACYEECLKQ